MFLFSSPCSYKEKGKQIVLPSCANPRKLSHISEKPLSKVLKQREKREAGVSDLTFKRLGGIMWNHEYLDCTVFQKKMFLFFFPKIKCWYWIPLSTNRVGENSFYFIWESFNVTWQAQKNHFMLLNRSFIEKEEKVNWNSIKRSAYSFYCQLF